MRRLYENIDITKVRTLYHASHVGNLKDIQQFGVMPMHGEIVTNHSGFSEYEEVYGEEYENWEDQVQEVAFFSPTDPGFLAWQIGNYMKKHRDDVTIEDMRQNGMVALFSPKNHADEIYCMDADRGTAHRLDGEDELYDIPAQVESVDCFSLEPVMADYIFTGDKLIAFLERKFPKLLAATPDGKAMLQKKAMGEEIKRIRQLAGIE